jgi:hypothetical protein
LHSTNQYVHELANVDEPNANGSAPEGDAGVLELEPEVSSQDAATVAPTSPDVAAEALFEEEATGAP